METAIFKASCTLNILPKQRLNYFQNIELIDFFFKHVNMYLYEQGMM